MEKTRQMFEKLLEIVGFKDDKTEMANKIITVILTQAMTNLFEKLKKEDQDVIKSKAGNPESAIEELKKHFEDKEVEDAIQKASTSIMTEYFKTIEGDLTEEQKKAIAGLGDTFMV